MNKTASLAKLFLPAILLLMTEMLVRVFVAGKDGSAQVVSPALFMSSLAYLAGYLCIWLVSTRFSLLSLTLLYLGLPYLFFAAGWLHWVMALMLAILVCWTLWRIYSAAIAARSPDFFTLPASAGIPLCLAFLVIVLWLHFSGSGGNGYQNIDYIAHNGRLKELIDYSWPVRYGEGRVLIFYVGYYLPAAVLGKFFGLPAAFNFLYFWTLTGVWLAFLWLVRFAPSRYLVVAALMMVCFGGWDAAVYLLQNKSSLREAVSGVFQVSNFSVDLWAGEALRFNIGAYLSNTFQLYWAPHQIIAGWLVAALLLAFYVQGQYRVLCAVYILCVLWAPMLLLALIPLLFLLCISQGFFSLSQCFSKENIIAGGGFSLVFGLYYIGGSALVNPAGWLWQSVNIIENAVIFFAFFLFSWGLYATCIFPVIRKDASAYFRFFIILLGSLFFLPWYKYGDWADLMCRGSAPLMFLLLVFMVRGMVLLEKQRRYPAVIALVLLLLPGSVSALRHFYQSYLYYQQDIFFDMRSIDSPTASEYIGKDDSLFFRYLAR